MLPMSMPAAAALTSMPGSMRRVEQGELPDDALDVHAVADLEQPVGDGVPVAEQLVVAAGRRSRASADAEQRAAAAVRRRPLSPLARCGRG